jgi:hypothetical protein
MSVAEEYTACCAKLRTPNRPARTICPDSRADHAACIEDVLEQRLPHELGSSLQRMHKPVTILPADGQQRTARRMRSPLRKEKGNLLGSRGSPRKHLPHCTDVHHRQLFPHGNIC